MGSAIIAYSAMHKAEKMVGRENLYFLIFEKNRESVDLLAKIPAENVITIDDSSLPRFLAGALRAVITLRKLSIDAVVDLELFSRCTALLSYACGARIRAGFYNYSEEGLYRGSLFTHRVYYNSTQHMALNFLALVGSLDADTRDFPLVKKNFSGELRPAPRFIPSEEESRAIQQLLDSSGFKRDDECRLIVLNPDPGLLQLRGWPLENYGHLVSQLSVNRGKTVFAVIGLSRSHSYYKAVSQAAPAARVIDLTGKTRNLREVLALLSVSDLLITTDSGPAHMAVLTGINSIVLFGPETPLRYAPLSPGTVTMFAGLSCSPCYSAANHRHSVCRNNVCMQAITVKEVLSRVEGMLGFT